MYDTAKDGWGAGAGAGLDAPAGGSGVVAQSGCVGHARYGIPKLEERSTGAPHVRMRRECKMGNCATMRAKRNGMLRRF
eukprot:432280-Pleurochrysis_carterae.AAC.3